MALGFSGALRILVRAGLATSAIGLIMTSCGGQTRLGGDGGSGGGLGGMAACSVPTDCTLVSAGCCGDCGNGTSASFNAINFRYVDQYTKSRGCDGVACGPCPLIPDLENTSKYFTATCSAGQCKVVDIRTQPATECGSDSDCTLRVGARCCEGCGGGGIVAVNSRNLQQLVCGAGPIPCPACAPLIPAEYVAKCSAGHCAVTTR